jgi:hypothetical protein
VQLAGPVLHTYIKRCSSSCCVANSRRGHKQAVKGCSRVEFDSLAAHLCCCDCALRLLSYLAYLSLCCAARRCAGACVSCTFAGAHMVCICCLWCPYGVYLLLVVPIWCVSAACGAAAVYGAGTVQDCNCNAELGPRPQCMVLLLAVCITG